MQKFWSQGSSPHQNSSDTARSLTQGATHQPGTTKPHSKVHAGSKVHPSTRTLLSLKARSMTSPEAYEPQRGPPSISQHPLNQSREALSGGAGGGDLLQSSGSPSSDCQCVGGVSRHTAPGTSYQGPWFSGCLGWGGGRCTEGRTDGTVKVARETLATGAGQCQPPA